jgi:shikimate dehydrogenase
VLVIGADACGRAAALELALAGATRLVICDPDTERSRSLAEALTSVHAADAGVADWQAGVVVPADVGIVVLSSLGGQGAVVSGLRPDLVVADALLAGGLSPVAALAASAGCCVVDGIEIHAAQTAIDFQTLTGLEPDIDMLRDSLEEFLS